MIPGDAKPIGHHTPYPRIPINDPVPVTKGEPQTQDEYDEAKRKVYEGARIWRLVTQAAEGTNVSVGPAGAHPGSSADWTNYDVRVTESNQTDLKTGHGSET